MTAHYPSCKCATCLLVIEVDETLREYDAEVLSIERARAARMARRQAAAARHPSAAPFAGPDTSPVSVDRDAAGESRPTPGGTLARIPQWLRGWL